MKKKQNKDDSEHESSVDDPDEVPTSESEEEKDSEEEEEDEDEEEEEDDENSPPRSKRKRQKKDDSDDDTYKEGAFVVLKSELKKNEAKSIIWKLDTHMLMQKFLPSEKDGKIIHVSTNLYAGWAKAERKHYLVAPVTPLKKTSLREEAVEFHRDRVEELPDVEDESE
ncbi:hypothetical protein J437_LFUL009071 [Ladona fulva]|uniref:Uncharacterized protein n=1 Tax=Ladona fulva TaxID=123851 RepID=A0A8K0P189_LADFU|nr:hypothetical protein J437_LFUL009071 [Ladona fulva]